MRWFHPDHEGRGLRLAYCLNLHAAESAKGVLDGLREITVPLARRLAGDGDFGVGMYLPWRALQELESPAGEGTLDDLRALFEVERLDPFTFNAFPFGGFHERGLKQQVFEPTWADAERVEFTRRVARLAGRLTQQLTQQAPRASGGEVPRSHVSISTHGGRFGSFDRAPGSLEACAANYLLVVRELAEIEEETGQRIVLSVEAEPRSSASDSYEAARLIRAVRELDPAAEPLVVRHLGTCLDTCHSAVEFEEPERALANATSGDTPLGKVQFSSALRLVDPAGNDAGREALLALAEPVFLHQVTGRWEGGFVRALDLPEAREHWEAADPGWRECDEWRCHFHVPVDLDALGASPVRTTRDDADDLLARVLADPALWGTRDLHLEIETYTWDVLPGPARGAGDLVDGLEREYEHVLARLAAAGWQRAPLD